MKSLSSLLWRYLYEKRKMAGFFFLTVFIFLLITNLNRLDYFSEIFYAAVIIGFLLLAYGVFDFRRYVREYKQLYFVLENPEDIYARLPESRDLHAELYAEIIREMDERRRRLLTAQCIREKEQKDYYGMWVHQIKTPIQAARLLLERDEMKGLEAAKNMEEEIFKTEQYVEMVLYYLRCQSMSEDLVLKEYVLMAVAKQAVRKYAVLFINSGLSVSVEDTDISIVTDEKWLGFVLEQLISNAVKYTKRGGISIYLDNSCREYQGERLHTCLVIEDSGIGIRSEDLPRIFDKGFTGFNGRLDQKSTGIGLYLCREILRKLAVPVRVESSPGEGTKVYLYFFEKPELSERNS